MSASTLVYVVAAALYAATSSAVQVISANMAHQTFADGGHDPACEHGPELDATGHPVVPLRTTVETDGGFTTITIVPESA